MGNKKSNYTLLALGIVILCVYYWVYYMPISRSGIFHETQKSAIENSDSASISEGNSLPNKEDPTKKEVASILQVTHMAPADPNKLTEYYKSIPKIDNNVIDPFFWITKTDDADKVLMDYGQIDEFNRRNIKHYNQLVDLSTISEYISKDTLRSKILNVSSIPTSPRYSVNNKRLTSEDYKKLTDELNLTALLDNNEVKYGLSWRRTQMRTFPTYEGAYSKLGDFDFDMFMETAIYTIEPMVIYHTSTDGKWYFVQIYNYTGWVPKEDIAIADKQTILGYVNSPQFLVVTSSQIEIIVDENKILYDMGTKIPIGLESGEGVFNVILPLSREDGTLSLNLLPLAQSQHFSAGYLPYTKANIIKQAFEFQGERYGWGGMYGARDCSAFIMDIYRTFGIKLPRNASQQGKGSYGVHYSPQNLRPVSPIYMNGHTMLYLGEHNGEHYMIHDFAGFYKNNSNGGTAYEEVMRVLVTPLSIQAAPGRTFRGSLYGGREFVLTQ